MEATYHLNPGELDEKFLKAMQTLFLHHRVKVTVEIESSDETDSIRSNAYLNETLMRRLKNVEDGLVREVNLSDYQPDA
ncbi:hypothetical protein [Spirosoma spitsbergense]|jgi:hypothetical protein|uniref:hypothetical protein n=1 Tax=Spirosoma spitsbergense TaxID=431554 RepID=UPI00035F63AA|nr:hypothetical protein [Spirosoma spitsbergense]